MARIEGDPVIPGSLLPAPEHLSYSQVSQLSSKYEWSCARKWGYEKRLGLPFVSSGALVVGSAFDEACNHYFTSLMAKVDRPTALGNALKVGKETLDQKFAESLFREDIDEAKQKAYHGALRIGFNAFSSRYNETNTQVGAVQSRHEFRVNVNGNSRAVVGYSDRIDADGTIVDHKWTGSAKWDAAGNWDMDWVAEKRDQLVVYWLSRMAERKRALGAGLPWDEPPVEPAGKLVVVVMRSNSKTANIKDISLEFDKFDQERVLGVIAEADIIARSGRYPAKPGNACGLCSHVERCRSDSLRTDPPFTTLTGVPETPEPELQSAAPTS